MFTATKDLLLPATVTGSWPRPRWYDQSLWGRPLDTGLLDVRFREQFMDAHAAVLAFAAAPVAATRMTSIEAAIAVRARAKPRWVRSVDTMFPPGRVRAPLRLGLRHGHRRGFREATRLGVPRRTGLRPDPDRCRRIYARQSNARRRRDREGGTRCSRPPGT